MTFLERTRHYLFGQPVETVKPFGKPHGSELAITLCDTSQELTDAFLEYFRDADDVEILKGNILACSRDALVSPANSFGDMSGGLDKAIDDFCEGAAQVTVRNAIGEQHLGELAVGNALIVPMDTKRYPFLVVAPTMRIPGNVKDSINAYLAMRAALVAIAQHNSRAPQPIRSVAVPGMCTGVGGMPPGESAEQMRVAYDMVIRKKWTQIVHPALAPYALRRTP